MTAADTGALGTLLAREETARDAALQALQQAETQLTQARLQAQSLDGYRQETINRWTAQTRVSATPEMLHGYRTFLERLDQALVQQAGTVQRAEAVLQLRLQERRAAEMRVAAISKLIGRRLQDHQLAMLRRDQRSSDEVAQRHAWGRGSNSRMGPLN